ncbi:unnamed protein product [Hermetia illucens]|uniref:Uncharacterized protein n=1 Tax=Hermetia illucens TaxID=343691 RepID=A0A7R8YQT7_HERIL|nr:unnamed protein product [Hermetia illucens]
MKFANIFALLAIALVLFASFTTAHSDHKKSEHHDDHKKKTEHHDDHKKKSGHHEPTWEKVEHGEETAGKIIGDIGDVLHLF